MIDIGKSARLRVIAEGVETRPQLMFLKLQGCTEGQGYYLGPSVAAGPAAKLLEAGILQEMHLPSHLLAIVHLQFSPDCRWSGPIQKIRDTGCEAEIDRSLTEL